MGVRSLDNRGGEARPPVEFDSLIDLLHHRATRQPHDRAYVFVSDRGCEEAVLTFGDLDRRARAVGGQLAARGQAGNRALLLFQPGLDFIVGYFACLYAGIIAVPMMVPRRASARDSADTIVVDCSPRFVLTSSELLEARPDLAQRFPDAGFEWVTVDASGNLPADSPVPDWRPDRSDIAFLQYTSGSTSAPKGVMLSHANLLANSEMIRLALGNTWRSTYVSWVPLYHDMGLILNVLQSLYVGALCVLMAPVTFMQRPLTWLRAIHDYRAEVATAPNFAYDLCVDRFRPDRLAGSDLSDWKVALNGAETVRADTIERFATTFGPYGFDRNAFFPAYGLAEATLLASAGKRREGPIMRSFSRTSLDQNRAIPASEGDKAQTLVGCGRHLVNESVAIVDPQARQRLPTYAVGEIWLRGPNIPQGYWRNPEATAQTFKAQIEDELDACWLRTGDLGFLDHAGELFITGRSKEMMIIRGINHYPQDVENSIQNSHPALRRHGGAAFTVDERGEEKLVIVQEVERVHRHAVHVDEISACIREAVANEHELSVYRIALIRPGSLPKTTSGKIQRGLARQLWLDNSFDVLRATAAPTS